MSEYQDGIREDAIKLREENEYLDSMFGDENEQMEDKISEFLDTSDVFSISETVINYASEDEFAATLKAMLTAYNNQYEDSFIIFAKSFCNVAIQAIEKSLED